MNILPVGIKNIRRICLKSKKKNPNAFSEVTKVLNFNIKEIWGDVIEDRDSQITFSALGQKADLTEKNKWDPDFAKRKKMKAMLDDLIPEFSVKLGGSTSVDVTRIGVDKACSRVEMIIPPKNGELLLFGSRM